MLSANPYIPRFFLIPNTAATLHTCSVPGSIGSITVFELTKTSAILNKKILYLYYVLFFLSVVFVEERVSF